MNVAGLFNYRVGPKGEPKEAGARTVSAFLTPQSLATFPGASGVVLILWKVSGQLVPGWQASHVVAAVLSLVVGALVYLASITDKNLDHAPVGLAEKVLTLAIGLINSVMLYAAATGLG